MTSYEQAPLVVDDELSAQLQWKADERFGDHGDHLLTASKHAVEVLCAIQQLSIDGWVQNGGRSVIASANQGQIIVKSPLFDGFNTISAIAGYSESEVGPTVYGMSVGENSDRELTQCAVAMQRMDGSYFHTSETPTVAEVTQIVTLAGDLNMNKVPLQPYFLELEERIALECFDANRRAQAIGDTTMMEEVIELSQKIIATDRPYSIRHGNLDVRNVMHHNGDMKLLDPEPVVAPAEFDVATLSHSIGVCPREVAATLDLDVGLTLDLHQFFSLCGALYQRFKGRAMS